MKLGQNFVKYFVRFLGNGVSRKIAFEIYWPLKTCDFGHKMKASLESHSFDSKTEYHDTYKQTSSSLTYIKSIKLEGNT